VLVVAFSLTAATSSPAAATGQATARAAIAIENFGRVSDAYYRGAQPEGRDYADLAALGIKTVIDLQTDGEESEAGLVTAAGMKFYRIPLTTRARPAPEAVTQFLALVNDKVNQPVYVHCQGGHHRTGIMTAVYRMTQEGWTADRAYREMQQYGFGPAFLHAALKDFVYDYASTIVPASSPATAPSPVSVPLKSADDVQLRQ
jgi:uncharacterized protein (TIGR01244 family)